MRYKVVVAYDGSKFIGWQLNPTGVSVQESITIALKSIFKENLFIVGAGRTDKGVSAYGQVFHFDAPFLIEPSRLQFALNNQLHPAIHIVSLTEVDNDFHARYHALWKGYRYSIEMGEFKVLLADYIFQLNKPLDIQAMQKAASIFIGTIDFTSFNTSTVEEVSDQVRTIYKINFKVDETILHLDFYGDGFLRYMIRMLVGTLIEVGLHRLSIDKVKEMLDAREKGVCRYKAPASGLKLVHVEYDNPFENSQN